LNSSEAMDLFVNPLFAWARLARKAGEMAMGASQVIAHRANRFASAASAPSLWDQREFALMVQEKRQAASESAQAVGIHMWMLNQQIASLAFKQMLSATVSLMFIATSRNPAESGERYSRLTRNTVANTAIAASKLSGSTVKVAQRVLKPVHTRVLSNARRLTKR